MHSDGVYFEREEQPIVNEKTICEYSGLPSVESYIEEENQVIYQYVDIKGNI